MNTTVESLQALYVKLGGSIEDVADKTTIPEMLDAITLISGTDKPEIDGISINGGAVVTPDENGIIDLTIGDGSTAIDPELSPTSTNPVQNKIVTGEINSLNESVTALNGSLGQLAETKVSPWTTHTSADDDVTTNSGYYKTSTNEWINSASHTGIYIYAEKDTLVYCTSSPSDSTFRIFSAETFTSANFVYGSSKSYFPTKSKPYRMPCDGYFLVTGKTTDATVLKIYTATDYSVIKGTLGLSTQMQADVDKALRNTITGYVLLSEITTATVGRWASDGAHTSGKMAYALISAGTEDRVVIADSGYYIYTYFIYDGTTIVKNGDDVCAVTLKAGYRMYINLAYIGDGAVATGAEMTPHYKVYSTTTGAYADIMGGFHDISMYNNVGFIGDSYTARRSAYNNCWCSILASQAGFTATLFAHSGYHTKTWIANILPTLLADTAKDLYWLALGINDSSRIRSDNAYLVGSADDLSAESYEDYPDTFWGNYGRIIENIKAHAPNARIVIQTVIYHDMRTAQKITNSTNIPPINNAILGLAEYYGIPCIDLRDDLFYWSATYQDNMERTAYTHPDPVLFPGMANANRRLFAKAVADNIAYFKQ